MPALRRRGSRRIALEVLYEHEVSGLAVEGILERYASDAASPFAAELVSGVLERRAAVDEVISRYAEDWTIDRMPVVDRSLLRLGIFELLYLPDVPPAVTINEAVELAKKYSTEDSSRFVNGMLSRVAEREASRA